MPERVVELDLGCYPEAAISGEILLENDRRTFLLFNAVKLNEATGLYADTRRAIVEFDRCSVTKFGYPNDEAWSAIPRSAGLTYAGYEVFNSTWEHELVDLNRYAFPKTGPVGLRHFLFLFTNPASNAWLTDTRSPSPPTLLRRS